MILQLGLLFIFIAIIVYILYMLRIYSYWRRRGVIGPTPYPVVGNYSTVLFGKESEGDLLRKIYEQYPNEKFVGIYKGVRPVLVIRDPDFNKYVFIKDSKYFADRCIEKHWQVFNKSLFIMKGDARWRTMRTALSPIFTNSKLAKLIPYVQKAIDSYLEYVDYLVSNNIDHEIRGLQSKYMIEFVGNVVLGVEFGVFRGNDEFKNTLHRCLAQTLQDTYLHTIAYICPPIIDLLAPIINREFERRMFSSLRKFVTQFIYKPRDNETASPIFVDAMVDLKKRCMTRNGQVRVEIDDEDIVQQAVTFSSSFFESLPTVQSYMIHQLAINQDIQEKCYKEIKAVLDRYNGEITLEALFEMKYLQMTMDETLRMHPMSHCLDRKCVSKYTFPDTNVTIDKSIFVFMPAHGFSQDPKYFPNPDVFDPERFSSQNKAKIRPYVYMPFGEGPRNCLGMRSAKIFLIMGMANFLLKYKLSPSAKTKPIRYNPAHVLSSYPLGGIWVKIESRN